MRRHFSFEFDNIDVKVWNNIDGFFVAFSQTSGRFFRAPKRRLQDCLFLPDFIGFPVEEGFKAR